MTGLFKLMFSLIALFTALHLTSVAAFAQGVAKENDIAVNDTEFRDVANDLRCPTCTGLSVLDSDAPFSVQIKNEVKEQLASGKEKDEILKFFTERYGPWILRAPPKEGIHLLAWAVPMAALILGPLLLWLLVWSRKGHGPTDEGLSRPVEDVVREMNEKLDELRRSGGGAV